MRLAALLWCAIAVQHHVDHSAAAPLAYPEGMKPGDQISGHSGEYSRYSSVLIKPPDDEDRLSALKMSEEIKCTACETILQRLLMRAESKSEDHIMDQLDGDVADWESSGNQQEDMVAKNRKGCNKHFKDELLEKGYMIKKCPQPLKQEGVSITIHESGKGYKAADAGNSAEEDSGSNKTWCLLTGPLNVGGRGFDTYSNFYEAVYYACEKTVARHGHELASYLSSRLEEGGDANAAIKDGCRKIANCESVKPVKKEKKEKVKEQKKAEKAKVEDEEEEKSPRDIEKELRAAAREKKRRSRKKEL